MILRTVLVGWIRKEVGQMLSKKLCSPVSGDVQAYSESIRLTLVTAGRKTKISSAAKAYDQEKNESVYHESQMSYYNSEIPLCACQQKFVTVGPGTKLAG
jgi:hypothetical protein